MSATAGTLLPTNLNSNGGIQAKGDSSAMRRRRRACRGLGGARLDPDGWGFSAGCRAAGARGVCVLALSVGGREREGRKGRHSQGKLEDYHDESAESI